MISIAGMDETGGHTNLRIRQVELQLHLQVHNFSAVSAA